MAKYYVDLNGKYQKLVESWDECVKLNADLGGLNFKKFSSKAEAETALKEAEANKEAKETKKAEATKKNSKSKTPKVTKSSQSTQLAKNTKFTGAKKSKPEGYGVKPHAGAYIIGCDEVGKVEPFKQMVSVAVFADPTVSRDIKGGDSKGNSKEHDIEIGKAITEFTTYDEIDGQAHYNKELGIIYCVKVLTNKQYNVLKDTGRKADLVLSCLHNASLLAVYDEAKKQGFNVDCFVIDDYLSNSGDHRDAFANYIEAHKAGTRKINDVDADMYLTTKAENKYPDTVGLASNIGDYVDQLWQKKCQDDFLEAGIKFEADWFSNFGADAQNQISKVFDLLKDKYGDVDDSPYIPKHTKYYTTYKSEEVAK